MSEGVRSETTYFQRAGRVNTEKTFEIAKKRAEELGILTLLVASTTGETGLAAARAFGGFEIIVVTHCTGFHAPNEQELTAENCDAITSAGAKILTCTHAFGGIGRAVRRKLNTYQLDELIAYTLRIFGEGLKVAVEIALMAADAGLVQCNTEVIAIGGTGKGADTAAVIRPAHAQDFFDLRVVELLCKPRLGGR